MKTRVSRQEFRRRLSNVIFYSFIGLSLSILVYIVFVPSKIASTAQPESLGSSSKVENEEEEKQAKEEATTPKKEIVCLDAGHGGKDVGSDYKNIFEANLNLEVALKTKKLLEDLNYRVFLTRDDDVFIYKRDRSRYCNSVKADIMVSIHHNAYKTDSAVDYTTTLYYKSSDKALASSIVNALSEKLDTRNQGIAKFDNSLLYVAEMPAALSEAFFVTSNTEQALLKSKSSTRLDEEAQGITDGIVNYFNNPEQSAADIDSSSLQLDRTDDYSD